MPRLRLADSEISEIRKLIAELASQSRSVEEEAVHREAPVLAQELPRRVRKAVLDFKLLEPRDGCLIVSNYPIDDAKIGSTPAHWRQSGAPSRALEEELFLVLLGSLLGTCIGWSTQQDGRVVHDILPIKEHTGEQLGSGSEQLLWWHTEDAFHPYRGDYLGMACLRNQDRTATTFATLEGIELSEAHWNLLFEPHFTIRPDESHLVKNKASHRPVEGDLAESYVRIDEMNTRPDKIAVLFGDRDQPYMRLDPYFMDEVEDHSEAQAALDGLIAGIDANLRDLVLEAGDFCLIDNFQAVHGRRPFKARFDGTDRWMKRVNVVRDLRKSRDARSGAQSLIIS